MNKLCFRICIVLTLLYPSFFSACLSAAPWPQIQLQREIAASDLAGETITIEKDPVYQTQKRYQAYPLKPLLDRLREGYTGDPEQAVLVFTATDGYKVAMAYADAVNENGFLAFRDLSAKQDHWVRFRFGKEYLTPAPYYLVWSKPGIDKWRYPWPFQLETIALLPAEVYFGKAAPVSESNETKQGFNAFTRFCIRCHTVNGSGGSVGPELNNPQNVSELYDDEVLKGLILNNPQYRQNSKMPIFKGILGDTQLHRILAYLKSMKRHKLPRTDETD